MEFYQEKQLCFLFTPCHYFLEEKRYPEMNFQLILSSHIALGMILFSRVCQNIICT